MGRQIQICTTDDDNLAFEQFLKQNFDCVFFQPSAPTAEELVINSFKETGYPFNSQILVWNKSFPWVPAYKPMKIAERKYYLLENTRGAPLIEFSKTILNKKENGRIYWEKYFLSTNLNYDVADFERFYLAVTRWIINNAAGKTKYAGINTYYLEHAWRLKMDAGTKTQ